MTGGSVAAPEPVPALFIIPDRGLHGLKCSSQKMTLKYLETQWNPPKIEIYFFFVKCE